ncbi:MAG: hypothetical protein ABSC23_12140 [Bryobacteraceae bacterium]|jgi:hypothetical protein
MGNTLLVNTDLDAGKRILKTLDEANVRVDVAMWASLQEYGDARLILASRQLDAMGLREAYGAVLRPLRNAGLSVEERGTFMILRMKDPFIRDLRRIFARAKSVAGMRLGGQVFGDRFIEDAYVYRIS